MKDLAFSTPVGDVTTPYVEGTKYTIAKVIDRRVLPDSASVRHILLGDPALPRGQKPLESQYELGKKQLIV